MLETITDANGNDGELLAEGGPDATKTMEVRHLATMLPKSKGRILSSMKATMGISLATTKTLSASKFEGLGEGEGIDESDDPLRAFHAPTSDGRSLEEDSSKRGIAVPHSTSDGSTGGGTIEPGETESIERGSHREWGEQQIA